MDLGDVLQLLFGVLATLLGAIAIVIAWSANKGKCALRSSCAFNTLVNTTNCDPARFYEGSRHFDSLAMYHYFPPTIETPRSFVRRATLVVEEAR